MMNRIENTSSALNLTFDADDLNHREDPTVQLIRVEPTGRVELLTVWRHERTPREAIIIPNGVSYEDVVDFVDSNAAALFARAEAAERMATHRNTAAADDAHAELLSTELQLSEAVERLPVRLTALESLEMWLGQESLEDHVSDMMADGWSFQDIANDVASWCRECDEAPADVEEIAELIEDEWNAALDEAE